jgi:2-polyprenyl-3-methyl-5-hydroxy-6-metoxy-1,4-benzoquinol methylase
MVIDKRGWFAIDGVQRGDRTLAQQMAGLQLLPELVHERTVLDLGCAEGLIAVEAVLAGAVLVDAVDYNEELLETAVNYRDSKGIDKNRLRFHRLNLADALPTYLSAQYDVVLALSIIHKLYDMTTFVRRMAEQSKYVIVIRYPTNTRDGIVHCKYNRNLRVDVPRLMRMYGFAQFAEREGSNAELVVYWRRLNGNR